MTTDRDPLALADRLGLDGARPGWVHLVGAGPGDPGLLTLRGAALLASADLVAYDRLADPRLLDLLPSTAEAVRVGKNPDRACRERTWTQDEISVLLIRAAREGKAVVRLKGGDPFVFGRGGEEALACRDAGVPFEVVSGVSSAIAGPAAAGIPVTHRGLATGVAFVTGHESPDKQASQVDWASLAGFHGTLVFLMGVRTAGDISRRLREHGRDPATPAAVVQWATTPRQRILHTTLGALATDLAASGLASPATIVVGDVAEVGRLLGPTGAGPDTTTSTPAAQPPADATTSMPTDPPPADATTSTSTHTPAALPLADATASTPASLPPPDPPKVPA